MRCATIGLAVFFFVNALITERKKRRLEREIEANHKELLEKGVRQLGEEARQRLYGTQIDGCPSPEGASE